MKCYWVLFNCGKPDALVADIIDFKGVEDFELCVGKPLASWDPNAFVAVGEDGRSGPPDDVLQTGSSAPIFSPRLQWTLDQATITGIQFLPVQVRGVDTEITAPFAVANVLHRLPLLDTARASFSKFADDYFIEERRGSISGLRRPVLRWTPELQQVDIFRLTEFWPPVFVSQRFRDIYRLGKFTGIAFQDVEVTRTPK